MQLKNPDLLKTGLLINNEWLEAKHSFEVINPATGECITKIADASADDAEKAIAAADAAFQTFRHSLPDERAEILRKWGQLILENIDDLATILTSEMGKPLAEARGEMQYAASKFEWFAMQALNVYGDVAPIANPNARHFIIKQPIGVVAAITPWNWPAGMPASKLSTAIAAGCTVVLKPAEDTPLSALALVELGIQAGLPKGCINIVPCKDPRHVGDTLLQSPTVRKLSFTGSTAVGKQLAKQSADTLKKVTLELGGNAPYIIFDDADLEKAMNDLAAQKFLNAGQVCISPNRIFIHENIYEQAISILDKKMNEIKLGNGLDDGVTQGPQVNKESFDKIETMLKDAKKKGARFIRGGKPSELGGTFYEATLIADATLDMDVAHDEIFGPVAICYPFKDEADVIRTANDTHYGLAAYLYTKDIAKAIRVSEALEYGVVGINSVDGGSKFTPFGGHKQSGLGREGGLYGIEEYLESKEITVEF